jgi:DNA-binding beta-propeller fold protein YncE
MHAKLAFAAIACTLGACAQLQMQPAGTAATPHGRLMLSGNDGKYPNDGAYKVTDSPVPDTLTVLDASVFPPKKIAEIELQHTPVSPPTSIAITADEKLALVSAPNRVDPKDRTKLATDNYMQVVDLEASPPRVVDKVDLGHHPLGVAVNRAGTLALAAHEDGNVSVLSIQGKSVKRVSTVKVGEPITSPRGIAITPDGKWGLVTKRGLGVVGVLAIDGEKVTATNRDVTAGNNAYAIEVSDDGRYALVGNVGRGDGSNDSVTIIDLTRQPFRALEHLTVFPGAEGIAISPDSAWFAVGCQNGTNFPKTHPYRSESGRVVLFSMRDGKATRVGDAATGHNSQGVSFTPDGRHLVVQNYAEKNLAVYRVTPGGPEDTGERIPIPGYPSGLRTAGH